VSIEEIFEKIGLPKLKDPEGKGVIIRGRPYTNWRVKVTIPRIDAVIFKEDPDTGVTIIRLNLPARNLDDYVIAEPTYIYSPEGTDNVGWRVFSPDGHKIMLIDIELINS
jgi:hypothetical protein